jgi:cytochrome P450
MDCNHSYGIRGDELGADLLGLLFVSTTNAIPTLFWLFTRVFSSPALVEEIRAEVEAVLIKEEGNRMVIDHTKFPTHCLLLCSAYQETIRLTNIQASTRIVVQDTILTSSSDENGDKREYLVKKGSLVQTPGSITHVSPRIWGPSAEDFDPRRFMNLGNGDKAAEKQQKKAFIPFGGGKHLCPGRHFAFAEILGMIAVLVMGFDVEGEGGRPLEVPKGVRCFANATLQIVDDGLKMGFRIRRRQGWEKTQWGFVEA